MTAVVLSGATGAPVLPARSLEWRASIDSFLKGVVFYGLLVGGLVIPFIGSILQAYVIR